MLETSMPMADYDGHPTASPCLSLPDLHEKALPLRVLSEADFDHWRRHGYVVVRNAISQDLAAKLCRVIWDFSGRDEHDANTWHNTDLRPHRMAELNGVGMQEIYHHQLMWDVRQSQRVYDAFVDIWDIKALWVVLDRANLNLPSRNRDEPDGFIHWDCDTSLRPLPVGVQGVLSLSGQDEEVGGFHCVPGIYADLQAWIAAQPADRDPLRPDITGYETKLVSMEPGDLVIFNALQPHGVRVNRSADRARIAQYVSMFPPGPSDLQERRERIDFWREMRKPASGAFPGDPRGWEKARYGPAELSSLGRKLLGLDLW